jgi:hypothetical protein
MATAATTARRRRWPVRIGLACATATVVYAVLLCYPQPLFAYELTHAGITVHATTPIPPAMRDTLERVRARLDRSPLRHTLGHPEVFICQPRWLFALFARTNYQVGGIANALGQNVFLRESDMEHDRLIGPGGQPVAADRPLSYFIAHELMHIAQLRHLGPVNYFRLPRWTNDGYADYVARDIDLGGALKKFGEGARELNPSLSGLYLRYHLMVAYLLEKKRTDLGALLDAPPDAETIERELRSLSEW